MIGCLTETTTRVVAKPLVLIITSVIISQIGCKLLLLVCPFFRSISTYIYPRKQLDVSEFVCLFFP